MGWWSVGLEGDTAYLSADIMSCMATLRWTLFVSVKSYSTLPLVTTGVIRPVGLPVE